MKIVSEKTLDEFRGPGSCEWCGRFVRRREPHHIFSRGQNGCVRLDVAINLVALCAAFSGGGNCHQLATDGHLTRWDFLAVVAAREGLQQDQITDEIYRLRRTPKRA